MVEETEKPKVKIKPEIDRTKIGMVKIGEPKPKPKPKRVTVKKEPKQVTSRLIKEIKQYQTSDGELFDTFKEAKDYQNEIKFIDWYKNHKIKVEYSSVEPAEVMQWLKDNWTDLEFLKRQSS